MHQVRMEYMVVAPPVYISSVPQSVLHGLCAVFSAAGGDGSSIDTDIALLQGSLS